jgi:Xaa-Pro aminopeptidase
LKGHIALDRAIFPQGTSGFLLDVLARTPLWSLGLDYRHGTGHGVGAFLNVHEGPHGIGTRIAYNDIPLENGMTVTNGMENRCKFATTWCFNLLRTAFLLLRSLEPGYYHDHHFGIRIENIMFVRQTSAPEVPNNFGDKGYLAFEHVTYVPLGRILLNVGLLTKDERDWVDHYHRQCWDKVSPLLERGGLGWKWLEKETKNCG